MYVRPLPLETLAIGSFPHTDPHVPLDLMATCVGIPASPQLPRLSPWEDMLLGAIDGLFFVEADANHNLSVPLAKREENLTLFYERFYSGDLEFLALSPRSATGWNAFLARARIDPKFGKQVLKSQVVGPLTFGQSVNVEGSFKVVDNPEIQEACAQGLGAKAAWEAQQIRNLGKFPMIFLDEPGLSGYGSAFSTLSSEGVLRSLDLAITAARSLGPVMMGIHVCGNTDWGLLTQADLDIINCDAWAYIESVSLYPKELKAFLERGGYLAWGIVPAQGFESSLTPENLVQKLSSGWEYLSQKGLDLGLLASRSFLTSSCGLGSLSPEVASQVVN
ncbi:MAG: hypothetical protein LBF22_09075, partial [Deltaproteobacteria bacterium]|nr:hypothetical protein [Deltaproteobacteria bacterium]